MPKYVRTVNKTKKKVSKYGYPKYSYKCQLWYLNIRHYDPGHYSSERLLTIPSCVTFTLSPGCWPSPT